MHGLLCKMIGYKVYKIPRKMPIMPYVCTKKNKNEGFENENLKIILLIGKKFLNLRNY